ncbi:aspartyl-phosphate phosphatase Spo0E family protein [Desulfosporosinus acidiphilus]|nr:aspartyl-phosphate phosphatase Spo0E family protein [Desulfosporosinus acidiphilus]
MTDIVGFVASQQFMEYNSNCCVEILFKSVKWSGMVMSLIEILKLIEIVREKLNILGLNKPLSDPDVIQLSQRLDSLINMYNDLNIRKIS